MILFLILFLTFAASTLRLDAQNLDIFFIDVEGGAATLIVTPEKESVLIDSGWRRDDARDARRIHKVATEEAGLSHIDYLVTTHFHRDHFGGAYQLSRLIPIKNFLDSGPRSSGSADPSFLYLYNEYMKANSGLRRTLRVDQEIRLRSRRIHLRLLAVASNGETLTRTGRENPECAALKLERPDPSENARSIGLILEFGRFRFLNNGDLSWNVEGEQVCPTNTLGRIHAYQVSHHGLKSSNNPVLLRSIRPKVAIMANGDHKGGDPEVVERLRALDGLEDLFQLHLNLGTRPQDNTDPELIANLTTEAECEGHWIRLTVQPDGRNFSVMNTRNGVARSYSVD